MDTPNIDSFFTEVAALRNSQDSLRIENEKLKKDLADRPPWHVVDSARNREAAACAQVNGLKQELAQKQESWDKAANYRDRVLDLVKQCDEKSQRIAELCAEKDILEKRINERYTDANYRMAQLDRLCAFVKPQKTASSDVVDATINWINRLLEELSDVRDDWNKDHLTMKRRMDEALEALRNLMIMFEEFHKFGHIPWALDTKAASEARHILSKQP